MKFTPRHPVRTLITGLLTMLPLAATLFLLGWIWVFLAKYLGPQSAVGQLLTDVGLGVTESELIGYLLGLMFVVAALYVFGLLVEMGLQRGFARLFDSLLKRIPVVRTVYDVTHKLVALFARTQDNELKSMTPVWLYFGGKAQPGQGEGTAAGTGVLGFLSTPQAVLINGQPRLAVLVPTAPIPIGGGLLYVPPSWVEPTDLGMEAVTSIYMSMGVTSSQYFKEAKTNPCGEQIKRSGASTLLDTSQRSC